jgi:hypothetical protein
LDELRRVDGDLREEQLLAGRQAAGDALATGADTGRAVIAVIAAPHAAIGDAAAWAAAAYAAHVAADAIAAAGALTATYAADTGPDPYFAAFSAFSGRPVDRHYLVSAYT